MSAKTRKNWRELRNERRDEQGSDQLMDIVRELNGALEQRIIEMTTGSDGPRTSPPRFDPITAYEPIRIEKGRRYERS